MWALMGPNGKLAECALRVDVTLAFDVGFVCNNATLASWAPLGATHKIFGTFLGQLAG